MPTTIDRNEPGAESDDVPTTGRTAGGLVGGVKLLLKVLAAAVVMASFGVWVYAYSGFADRDPPDLLTTDSFAPAAERSCAAALDDLDGMDNALDAVDGPDRARQIRESTARLEVMLTELEQLPVSGETDTTITEGWLADWRVLVADRYRYADEIAQDPNAQFLVTDVGVAERLDKRITRVADTNGMPSCAAPGDVG